MPGDTIEAYPHHVKVTVDGTVLAETTSGLLHRHSYAPDIYIPLVDVRTELLHRNGDDFAARLAGETIEAIAKARPDLPALGDRITFDFNKIRLDVDGSQVRGHVRDPHKVITVTPVPGHLQMMLGEHAVVDSTAALELRETGLPARYYVPAGDVDDSFLAPSDRQTVCTYKGEATYYHLQTDAGLKENTIWCYATPWTDFAAEIGRIAGHYGLYSSAFDRVLIDGRDLRPSEADLAADRAMIDRPTVDQVLRNKSAQV